MFGLQWLFKNFVLFCFLLFAFGAGVHLSNNNNRLLVIVNSIPLNASTVSDDCCSFIAVVVLVGDGGVSGRLQNENGISV